MIHLETMTAIEKEAEKSIEEHNSFNSAHEGWAVMYEEVDELWEEVRKKSKNRSKKHMREEAIQIAATAIRFIEDLCLED
jgi:NTP pyrophosphatase (non-canonical NTP hydrolase)